MKIYHAGSTSSRAGSADWFTGRVRIDALFNPADANRVQGAMVTFEPGARTHWHTHPLGQTLVIMSGVGMAQHEGGEVQQIRPGDVVFFEAGEKHWHGAAPETAMSHLAIQEVLDGEVVNWLEPVSDEDYSVTLKPHCA